MMKGFEEKAMKIYDNRQKQERELEQFRIYLGLNRSELDQSHVKNNNNNKSPKKTAFLIDDSMLFKSRQKKAPILHSNKQTHSSSHYSSARAKGKT